MHWKRGKPLLKKLTRYTVRYVLEGKLISIVLIYARLCTGAQSTFQTPVIKSSLTVRVWIGFSSVICYRMRLKEL